jgi:hypothetical protein
MLTTTPPSPGLVFASFLYRNDLHTQESLSSFWEEKFGKSLSFVPTQNSLTSYYEKEMGFPLSRIFFFTRESFPREFLLSTKLQAIDWERTWSSSNKRMVNVDIGFLTLENFILATTKIYSHRVFIGQNIFAELTYQFQQGEWAMFPWTYPDYQDHNKLQFFKEARQHLCSIRKH